jgi:adenine-specific DNA-methyltransferase
MGGAGLKAPPVRLDRRNARAGRGRGGVSGGAGLGVHSQAIMPQRSVWTNDVQHFACNMAHLIISDDLGRLDANSIIACLQPAYRIHSDRLRRSHGEAIEREARTLASDFIPESPASHVAGSDPTTGNPSHAYQLFTLQYANSYLGLAQCIEVDALRYAIDLALPISSHFDSARRLALFALGLAVLKCSATTGHFAQFMKPSASNWKRYKRYRSSQIWPCFRDGLASALESEPVGKNSINKVHRSDCVALLESLVETTERPSVIYALSIHVT